MKIVVKPYKTDEFDKTIRSFSRRIRKEKGCLGYSVCRDSEKENTYCVFGEWKTGHGQTFPNTRFPGVNRRGQSTWRIIPNEHIRSFQNKGL
jgi:hypothetical protein